jgi:hypothetical protein
MFSRYPEMILGRTGIVLVRPKIIPVRTGIVPVLKNVLAEVRVGAGFRFFYRESFFRRLIRSKIVGNSKHSDEVSDAKSENFLFDGYFYVFTDDFYGSKN